MRISFEILSRTVRVEFFPCITYNSKSTDSKVMNDNGYNTYDRRQGLELNPLNVVIRIYGS